MKIIKKLKEGFTLVELVVVIAIIAILSGVSVAAYVGISDSAKTSAAEQEASQLCTLIITETVASFKERTYIVTWENGNLLFENNGSALTDAGVAKQLLDDIGCKSLGVTDTFGAQNNGIYDFNGLGATEEFEIKYAGDFASGSFDSITLVHSNGKEALVFKKAA